MAAYGVPKVSITMPIVYRDGHAWKNRVIQLVENAEDYIILSSFLASNSEELEELYATIERKAQEGVRIYFIVDGTGSFDLTETRFHLIPLKYLRESGVHYLEFNPLSAARLISGLDLAYRDHRKYAIIDGKTLALGGMNLNYISIGAENNDLQRDSMYEFTSPSLCKIMLDSFVPWWNEQSWDTVRREDFFVDESIGDEEPHFDAWYAEQYPQMDKLSGFYGSLLAEAEHSIKMLPFLPFMDEPMLKAFRQTVERGIAVTMIIPVDSRESNREGLEYMMKELQATGIELKQENLGENTQQLLHEKLMIIDSRYIVIGSSNFNYRTMNLAYDISMVIDNPQMALELENHYQTINDNSFLITKEYAQQLHSFDKWSSFLFGFFGG
jgi:cardiolipin synthase